jgi:ABC-type lipoprotein release transport system permease subunit
VWVLGTISIVFATSFVKGLVNQRIKERIDTSLGHAKITHKQYDTEKNARYFLNSETQKHKYTFIIFYKNNKEILHTTTRLNVRGLCNKKEKKNNKKENEKTTKGEKITKNIDQNIVDIYGINPETEIKIFALNKKIIAVNYLNKNFSQKNEIIIGNSFAKKNNIKLNDTLIIQYLSKEKIFIKRPYIVVGVFATQNENFDKTHIFTHKHTWREFNVL